MSIESKLLTYKQDMEKLEKEAERIKGSLEHLYDELRNEINVDKKVTNEYLIKKADELLDELKEKCSETKERINELMETIEEKYDEIKE